MAVDYRMIKPTNNIFLYEAAQIEIDPVELLSNEFMVEYDLEDSTEEFFEEVGEIRDAPAFSTNTPDRNRTCIASFCYYMRMTAAFHWSTGV